MISSDNSLVDATLSEILSLPLDRRRHLDPQRDVPRIRVLQLLLQVCGMNLVHCILTPVTGPTQGSPR